MKIKYKLIVSLIFGIFLVNFVLASTVNLYYSPNCPSCESVEPLINSLSDKYVNWYFNFYDITKGSYNVQGVPFITVITSDKRKIDLVGSNDIPKYLECELNEVSTLDCPTYSVSDGYNSETQSWFIR